MKDFSPLTDLDSLAGTLEKYGVAVLPNLFTDEECEKVKKSVFDEMASKHGVHTPDDFYKVEPIEAGILQKFGLSLLKEVLDLKTDERVVEAFRRVWPEANGELTTSFDGICIQPPPEQITDKPFFKENLFHTDQASNKKEKCCVQAFINLEPTETGDGCLSVLTKSHRFFNEFFDFFKISSLGLDWFVINDTTHLDWFINKGCEWKTIMAPKGSLVLWDSRTIHMGTEPRQGRPHPDHWRFVVYVCYTPAHLQTQHDTELKRSAYLNNRTTSHWPYNVNVCFKSPNDHKKNDLNNLTERHRKYLGI